MKIKRSIWGSLALGGMAAFCLSFIGAQTAKAADDRGQLTAGDYRFVCEAARGGGIEVSVSQLALQKSSDADVHHFAERMVKDHTKANAELAGLAAQKGAVLPDYTSEQNAMTDKLKDLSGAEFDKAYVKQMLSDHEKTVDLFQKEAGSAEDPDLKSWVVKTLPVLQEHLDMVQKLHAQIEPAK